MDVPTDVDRAAPIVVQHEIEIDAPLDRVWQLHTQVDRWPEWQQAITSATIEGDFEPGSSFDWSSYDFPVTSTIYSVDEGSRVLWGGVTGGVTGIHEWLFEKSGDVVHVTTTESFAGEPVEADTEGMKSLLDQSLVAWLGYLKAAAERPSN